MLHSFLILALGMVIKFPSRSAFGMSWAMWMPGGVRKGEHCSFQPVEIVEFNHLSFLSFELVLGTFFCLESTEAGHVPIHLALKLQIPLFLWACPNIASFQVQLVLGWLILCWYSLRLHATTYFIFSQKIQVSVLVLCDYFCYDWESFILQLEN